MIGRKLITKPGGPTIRDFGAGKTLIIWLSGMGGSSSMTYSGLKMVVDGAAKTLQELVLAGEIRPTVLMYTASQSTAYLMKSLLNLYTGGSTASSLFANMGILIGLKTGHVYSGIQLTASKEVNNSYDGIDLFLFDGEVFSTLSNTAEVIDALNQQTAAHTLNNVESTLEIEIGVLPKPDSSGTQYDGNSLVRVNYPDATLDDGRRCPANMWWYIDGKCEFVGVYDYLRDSQYPCIRIKSGANTYPFISHLYFE